MWNAIKLCNLFLKLKQNCFNAAVGVLWDKGHWDIECGSQCTLKDLYSNQMSIFERVLNVETCDNFMIHALVIGNSS